MRMVVFLSNVFLILLVNWSTIQCRPTSDDYDLGDSGRIGRPADVQDTADMMNTFPVEVGWAGFAPWISGPLSLFGR